MQQKTRTVGGFHRFGWIALDGVGWVFGADSLTRTDDLPLTRRLLYQLSYAGASWTLLQQPQPSHADLP